MAEMICLTLPFNNLASIIRQETDLGIRQVIGIDKGVCQFINNFHAIELMIEDEEGRHEAESSDDARNRLRVLRDAFCHVEDVLDAWNTRAGKLEMLKKLAKSTFRPTRKVCSFIPSILQRRYSRLVLALNIAFKTKNLNKTLLGVVAKDKYKSKFEELEPKVDSSFTDLSEAHARDLSDMSKVYGIRDNERKQIETLLLLSQSVQGQKLPVISIVGPRGIGKTTLAEVIFNDEKVNNYFDKRIWVSVSYPLDKIRVAKSILKSLEDDVPSNPIELETVLQKICQFVDQKKILLVLDDLCINDNDHIFWKQLKNSLKCGSKESRILITTCEENVEKMIGKTRKITLATLNMNDSWSFLSQVAFSKGEQCENFEDIGGKLVEKCKGLPIAIKILGSLLRFKRKIKDWQNVLMSEIWSLDKNEEFFPPLLLSYYDLPSTLRKCFLYCAIFPKNYEIKKNQLIKLWMSQSYLKAKGQKDMEKIGEEYFESLVMRSFFIGVQENEYDGSTLSYKIHDIVYNSFQFLKGNECFSMSQSDISKRGKVQHSMIIFKKVGTFPRQVYKERKLRSLLVEPSGGFLSDRGLSKLFDQLTCLRALALSNHVNISDNLFKEIPEGLNKLIHLRYLNLSNNRKIRKLPETLCELYNLQTLELSWCINLQSLPQRMEKLINLRHIVNDGTSFSYMPKGIEGLTNLRTLREFVVNGGDSNKASTFEFLKNLNHLQSLGIKILRNIEDLNEIKKAELKNKKRLQDLYLCFNIDEVNGNPEVDHDGQKNVLEDLATTPTSLERLEISCYSSSMMSSNLISSLLKLRLMSLDRCMNFEHLPPLGNLPCLESLSIRSMKRVKAVGNEFLGIEIYGTSLSSSVNAFPRLKHLEFQNLKEWNEWNYDIPAEINGENISIMPCLSSLKIDYCPKLEMLPDYICQKKLKNNLPHNLKEFYINYKKSGGYIPSDPSLQVHAQRLSSWRRH